MQWIVITVLLDNYEKAPKNYKDKHLNTNIGSLIAAWYSF